MTQSPDESDWSERIAYTVAAEVRRHRQRRGMSAQQLSDRCAELGLPIQRSVLANLESGRRSTVSVAEVLILAAALDVPPGVLIFPVGYVEKVDMLPGFPVYPQSAVQWISGYVMPAGADSNFYHSHPIFVVRLHDTIASRLDSDLQTFAEVQRELSEARTKLRDQVEKISHLESELERVRVDYDEIRQREREFFELLSSGSPLDYEEYNMVLERSTEISKKMYGIEREIASLRKEIDPLTILQYRSRSLTDRVTSGAKQLYDIRDEMRAKEILLPRLTERVRVYIGGEGPEGRQRFNPQPGADEVTKEIREAE